MELEESILKRAVQYAKNCDVTALKSYDIKMKSPVLFVLFGESVRGGLEKIKAAMSESVLNAEGAIYLLIGGSKPEKADSQVVYMPVEEPTDLEKKRMVVGQLGSEHDFLKQLGEKLIETKQLIMEKNKIFGYWEQMNVYVLTMARDVENVLIPDVMVLIKNKFSQDFKQIFMELFICLQETEKDAQPLNKALAISLFKEIESYQSADYTYKKPTEVLEDDLVLEVNYRGQLFDLVYLLTDKKENGQKIENALEGHYATVAALNILRNREDKALELHEAREQFNYNMFISNIREQGENRYCSARLAKVDKPGMGIYLSVACHLFKAYQEGMMTNEAESHQQLLEAAGLTTSQITELVTRCLPPEEDLTQLYSLISTQAAFNTLKNQDFEEAERMLFGDNAREFFKVNFEEAALKKLENLIKDDAFQKRLMLEVVAKPQFGPFAIKVLLEEKEQNLREKWMMAKEYNLDKMQQAYKARVGEKVGGKFSFLDKKYLKEVKNYLITKVYGNRYKALTQTLKIKVLDSMLENIQSLYEKLLKTFQKLEHINALLENMMKESQRYQEEYLIQNVNEYYESIVRKKLEDLKEKCGAYFLYDEKMMGNMEGMLKADEETILTRLFNVEEQYILNEEKYFNTSFENELLARANLLIDYEDKQVAAKSQLFDLLYQSLEENSKPCVHLDTTVSPHRYIEKYFFGDRSSEFMEYAYKRDEGTRNYKLGTISDQRKSIIEKLQLMGGFQLKDLVFYETGERYYKAYSEKGYEFHASWMLEKFIESQEEK